MASGNVKVTIVAIDNFTGKSLQFFRQFINDVVVNPPRPTDRDVDRSFENEVRLHGTPGDLA